MIRKKECVKYKMIGLYLLVESNTWVLETLRGVDCEWFTVAG